MTFQRHDRPFTVLHFCRVPSSLFLFFLSSTYELLSFLLLELLRVPFELYHEGRRIKGCFSFHPERVRECVEIWPSLSSFCWSRVWRQVFLGAAFSSGYSHTSIADGFYALLVRGLSEKHKRGERVVFYVTRLDVSCNAVFVSGNQLKNFDRLEARSAVVFRYCGLWMVVERSLRLFTLFKSDKVLRHCGRGRVRRA